jgi:diguanylate cyclase (GGDEF)-like protein/PAS domain S-box-containing protein
VKRWTEFLLVACAASLAVAQWLVPSSMEGLLSGLLLGLVILTVFSQRSSLQGTLSSLNEAHAEQLESERRYRALFDACSDAILVYRLEDDGRQGRLVEVNEAACLQLGYSRAQLLSMTAEDVHAPEARRHVQDRAQALSEAGILVFETVHITSDRQRRPVEVSARLVEIGGRRLCLTVSHCIAAHKELEGFLRGLTDLDELTGLLNRRGFFTQVENVRRRARRLHSLVLLVYLDVDGLKRVNDEMGHAAGDELLVAAADALRLAFREEDVVARLGGDEFVAMALLGRREDERLDCQAIAARLEEAVRAKRAELGEPYDFSVSHGSIVANADELDGIDELLARTDQRMYKAKRERRREADGVETMA